MKIQDLFLKPIDRPIDGVIKADDLRNLQAELEEYVVTRDVASGLAQFTERYLEDRTSNGVWISGFFGSGKSHLLKMLSLLLDGTPLPGGAKPSDILLPKFEDEILKANLRKCAMVPSRSILFNIDQKFDGIGGDHSAPILEVFVKVLNELQGYFGQQGYIASFERDLDVRGDFILFKDKYLKVNGRSWEADREAVATTTKRSFSKAYAAHFGVDESEAHSVMKHARDDYRVSVESFAKMVKSYIDRQPPGFRLNFFVDEVGQFIGQDSRLMLNLQTVAETLATVCNGRSWVFVTSQADLEGVLGGFRGMEAQDVSKIQGRFRARLTLKSADVDEVIQKRLLAKKEAEPEVLAVIYDREAENLRTLFRFGDSSVQLNGWRGSDAFCDFYPFHPYHFALFRLAIEQLSKHNAFTGKYTSVGERSMLEVFQEAGKALRTESVGRLATFDQLYDGLSATIRGDMQGTIKFAERQLGEGVPLRIMKALFLLKWVREFKATPRNVAILLIGTPDIDIRAHEKTVAEALALLESQSYLQKNGDQYEFLTDAEKDIETEIKSTDVDESQVSDLIAKVLFADVLRDPKIRFDVNAQDYVYARKLDDHVVGKDAELAVNVITMDNYDHGNIAALAMRNAGKAELLAVLPAEARFGQQARLFLKTQKYVQQNSSTGDAARMAILDQRAQQNSQRRTELQMMAADLLRVAPLYINGSRLEGISEGDARNRFAKAAQELVAFAYPNLKMLKGTYSESSLKEALLAPDDLLGSASQRLSEAEQEVLTYVSNRTNDRVVAEDLVRHFGRRPYGWYPMAVLTLLGRLFRMGKVELRSGELLNAAGAFELLKNSREHGNVRVRMQEQHDPARVKALTTFHHEFFDRVNSGTDARSVGQAAAEAMAAEANDLTLLIDQASAYPFVAALKPIAEQLRKLAERDPDYLVRNVADFSDELLAAKDDVVAPIKSFMHGAQRAAYDEVMAFLNQEAANFQELPAAELQPLYDLAKAEHPYRGSLVPTAKSQLTQLRSQLEKLLTDERQRALAALDGYEQRLRDGDEFKSLAESEQARVIALATPHRDAIANARFASVIRDRLQQFAGNVYSKQLELVSKLAANQRGGGVEPPAVSYISSGQLRAKCDLPHISNEEELEIWLEALRQAAGEELAKGRRISIGIGAP